MVSLFLLLGCNLSYIVDLCAALHELASARARTSMRTLSKPYGDTLKPRPNARYMPTQHVATLLGATCCVRLATLLQHVATCWVLLAQIWPFSNLSQQHPTCRNTSQQGDQKHATCGALQCCDMLRWHVAIVWPGLKVAEHSFNAHFYFADAI